ncbi:MAG: hypothetical protein A2542_01145 [Parcubacteria group bacterium RIFOXYD2_FULL_52_8]|nr:MAG: hypothetical protein A2542_01145 [Parcubacteria group bacterium RIFOXYD2_FULL_52_8]
MYAVEPGAMVAANVVPLTVRLSKTVLADDTFSVTSPTVMIPEVVMVASLYAANVRPGAPSSNPRAMILFDVLMLIDN